MVLLFVKMNARPEKRKELLQTLEGVLERIRKETGCVRANLYQNMENDRGFMVIEEWRNQEDLENHIRSDSFSVLLGANGLLDQTAVIVSHAISRSSGTEALLKTRRLPKRAD